MDLREQYIARRIDNWIFVAKNDGQFPNAPREGTEQYGRLLHTLANAIHVKESGNTLRYWGFVEGVSDVTGYPKEALLDIVEKSYEDLRAYDREQEDLYWEGIK